MLVGPLLGPLVAIASFVCSVGNVPLAAVLWNGGSSFGGVIAFIYADLIVVPILNIYRKYYGKAMMLFLLVTMYTSMALSGFAIEWLFRWIGWIPAHQAQIVRTSIQFNYTTVLNIIFSGLAALLLIRFFKTGGVDMLRMMDRPGGHEHAA